MAVRKDAYRGNPFFTDEPNGRFESEVHDARIVCVRDGEVALYRKAGEFAYLWVKLTWGTDPEIWVRDGFWTYRRGGRGDGVDEVVDRVLSCVERFARDKERYAGREEEKPLSWEDLC